MTYSNNFLILINLIPLIIVCSLISLFFFFFLSFICLSIHNKLFKLNNINSIKYILIHTITSLLVIIFIFILQIIFHFLFKIKELNNNDDLVNNEEKIRNYYFFIFIFIIQLFFALSFSIKTSFFSILIPIIFLIPITNSFFKIPNGVDFHKIILILFILFSLLFVFNIRLFKNQKFIIVLLFLFVLIGEFIIIELIINLLRKQNIENIGLFVFISVFSTFYFLICYSIIDFIKSWFFKANSLEKLILYNKNGFIQSGYSNSIFKNYIIKNKINLGFLLTFKLTNHDYITNIFGTKQALFIYNYALNILIKKLNKKILLLNNINNEPVFFLDYKYRSWLNIIIKEIFFELPHYAIKDKNKIKLIFKFYGVKYGINESSFDKINDCLFMVSKDKGINNKNKVIWYQGNKINKIYYNDNLSFLNNYNVILERINNLYFPVVVKDKKEINIHKIINNIKDEELKIIFIRNIAFKTLKSFYYKKDGEIVLPYFNSIINHDEFNLLNFLNNIDKIGIKYERIRILFLDKNIDKNSKIYKSICKVGINIYEG